MSVPRRLLELAELERDIACDPDRFEELAAVQAERDRALAALPGAVDAEERALLVLALEIQRETTGLIAAARDETARTLARLDQGRTTVQGYAPAGAGAGRTVDAAA